MRPGALVCVFCLATFAAAGAHALGAHQPAAESGIATTGPAETRVELDTPTGGWRVINREENTRAFTSAYPFNLIDRGRVRGRSPVVGRFIRKEALPGATDSIVINGAPMPLFSDGTGAFVRPYAFGMGSNSLAIVDGSNGRTLKRVQFYDASRDRSQAKLRVVLSWDDHQAEVDMHVLTPDGGHAYWAEPIMENGGVIDPDGVDGPGPEIFTMASPLRGTHQVWINYWGNFGGGGYHFDESTREKPIMTATITLITDENTLAEKQETLVVPLRRIGEMTLVKEFIR